MYVYNSTATQSHPIDYYSIEYIHAQNPKTITVKINPPKNRALLHIEPYHGVLKQTNNKIILTFENNNDYISAIFNTDLINSRTMYLLGVAIGISDSNQKIPVAKKAILTKEPIENLNELYLTLNETETISAKENYYRLKNSEEDLTPNHLEKYIKKIEHLNTLFQNLTQQGYYDSFYEQLAFKELSATHNIFQKVKNHHSYYVHYRKTILDTLIQSYKSERYKEIHMVMPIYKESNVFDQQSTNAITLQNQLLELSHQIEITIIFVLKDCQKTFKQEFIEFLERAHLSIDIYFVFKQNIEYEVNSIDFLYTDKSNFVITKALRINIPAFTLHHHKNIIDEYHAMFRKIKKRSLNYQEFMEDNNQICNQSNPILEKLVGQWYHYVHGSKKFWEDRVMIYQDGRVEYFVEEQLTEDGLIINREFQSVILLDDIKTKRLFTIVFDHQPYKIQKAFITKSISKQSEKEFDILAIGIFSRRPIDIEKAKEILGNSQEVRILEQGSTSDNLANYLIDTYGYLHSHQ